MREITNVIRKKEIIIAIHTHNERGKIIIFNIYRLRNQKTRMSHSRTSSGLTVTTTSGIDLSPFQLEVLKQAHVVYLTRAARKGHNS